MRLPRRCYKLDGMDCWCHQRVISIQVMLSTQAATLRQAAGFSTGAGVTGDRRSSAQPRSTLVSSRLRDGGGGGAKLIELDETPQMLKRRKKEIGSASFRQSYAILCSMLECVEQEEKQKRVQEREDLRKRIEDEKERRKQEAIAQKEAKKKQKEQVPTSYYSLF